LTVFIWTGFSTKYTLLVSTWRLYES